jgi:hypothetical protein
MKERAVCKDSVSHQGKSFRKGQLSIEFSLLMLISIAAFGITVFAILTMDKDFKEAMSNKILNYDKERIYTRVKELCLSGSGSAREIQLLSKIEQISFDKSNVKCEISYELPLQGKILVMNDNGKVILKKH